MTDVRPVPPPPAKGATTTQRWGPLVAWALGAAVATGALGSLPGFGVLTWPSTLAPLGLGLVIAALLTVLRPGHWTESPVRSALTLLLATGTPALLASAWGLASLVAAAVGARTRVPLPESADAARWIGYHAVAVAAVPRTVGWSLAAVGAGLGGLLPAAQRRGDRLARWVPLGLGLSAGVGFLLISLVALALRKVALPAAALLPLGLGTGLGLVALGRSAAGSPLRAQVAVVLLAAGALASGYMASGAAIDLALAADAGKAVTLDAAAQAFAGGYDNLRILGALAVAAWIAASAVGVFLAKGRAPANGGADGQGRRAGKGLWGRAALVLVIALALLGLERRFMAEAGGLSRWARSCCEAVER